MQFDLGIAKPVAQFVDLRFVAIVQVLACAEDFHQRDSGVPDAVEPLRGEVMIDEQMCGESALH
jgi:hypothetical protein